MRSRAKDLLDSYVGRKSSPAPCKHWKVRALERAIFKCFQTACMKNPEGLQHFIETSLPEQLLEVLQPYRLAKQASEISAPCAPEDAFSPLPSAVAAAETSRPRDNLPSPVAQCAVTAGNIGTEKATLSSAALQLPWASEECWERRWEQEPWAKQLSKLQDKTLKNLIIIITSTVFSALRAIL